MNNIFTPEFLVLYSAKIVTAALIAAAFFIIYKAVSVSVEKAIAGGKREQHIMTITSLFRGTFKYSMLFLALLAILQLFDINITAIIASAGIFGLALSFGAQEPVKDVIAGVSIVTEDRFTIGDEVQIGNVRGKVEKITLRTTVIRDNNGDLFSVANGSIVVVQNFSRNVLPK